MNRIFGRQFMAKLTAGMKKLLGAMPLWWNELQMPPKKISNQPANPGYVYLSACIQRMMGNDEKKGSVQAAMLEVCQRAGIDVLLPAQLSGHCCGQAFSSKGFFEAAHLKQRSLIDALLQWTDNGRLPVVCDFTSCTYTLLKAGHGLEPDYQQKLKRLKVMDSIAFLNEVVVPQLKVTRPKEKVVLHPGCAATKLQLNEAMRRVANACAQQVVIPADAGCCGMAGDRGFLFPELTESATKLELNEAIGEKADGYYAAAKTCEMALSHYSHKDYQHILYLVKEVSAPVEQ
jgi:D-lactate dehydrogenase